MKKLPAYKEAGAKCTDIMIILENGKIGKKNNREKSEVLVADCYCTRVGTFGTESAVRKRGGSRNNSSAQVDVYGIWYMIVEKAG